MTEGALVVVQPYPFGIARVLSSTDRGTLNLQWLGNANNKVKGPYEPGWNSSTRKQYYAAEARRATHSAYTAAQDKVKLNQRDVIMHGFELTKGGMLPEALLRAIARNPLIWWDQDAQAGSA